MNLYINNFHLPQKDIYTSEWIFNIIKKYFLNSDFNIQYNNSFKKNKSYIFIENFTDQSVKIIIKEKREKKIKVCLILTEFLGEEKLNQNIIENYNFNYLFLLLLKIKNFFIIKFLKKNNLIKKFFYKIFSKNIANYSFKRRFENLETIIPYADLIFTTHPEISKQLGKMYKKDSILLFPVLDLLKPKKKFVKKIKFTGELTTYRKKILNKVLESAFKNHNSNKFLTNNSKNFIYSIHPPKNSFWVYSSPIRYFMSIYKNEIPIVFDNFNDSFSRYLTIKHKMENIKNIFKNYQKNLKLMNKKIKKYNDNYFLKRYRNLKIIKKTLTN